MLKISSITELNNHLERKLTNNNPFYSPEPDGNINSANKNPNQYNKFIDEFWTSKQRQSSSIHEISYRACFKAELPRFFINLMSDVQDTIYDPFSGRGTTIIEAGIMQRNVISNDINPLSKIFCEPRLCIPSLTEIQKRLTEIPLDHLQKADIDLSMFYEPHTESELVSLRNYLMERKESGSEDNVDKWIRMIATNRLTGHSSGFFSVYTLPPNQAITPERQSKLNKTRNQFPEYRDVKQLILKKSNTLLKKISPEEINNLNSCGKKAKFLINDASNTKEIKANSVDLTVTSPPFLDIVNYSQDNWLRCWFNGIDSIDISKNITMLSSIQEWTNYIQDVFNELFRITSKNGWVAFEVGEVRNGKIRLDEHVVPLGINSGFEFACVIINEQNFTKTSNIWGIHNKKRGTNTNRIVVFQKTN